MCEESINWKLYSCSTFGHQSNVALQTRKVACSAKDVNFEKKRVVILSHMNITAGAEAAIKHDYSDWSLCQSDIANKFGS